MNKQGFVIFEVSGKKFGIDLSLVEEIVPAEKITGVPGAPFFLLGLTSVRGKVLSVIDCAKRYELTDSTAKYFLVCHVRGNVTAITIDSAIMAGIVPVRQLDETETKELRIETAVEEKFLGNAFELFEEKEDSSFAPTGRRFFAIQPDLFVSVEMASRIGGP